MHPQAVYQCIVIGDTLRLILLSLYSFGFVSSEMRGKFHSAVVGLHVNHMSRLVLENQEFLPSPTRAT
jgi:hypothetical protein